MDKQEKMRQPKTGLAFGINKGYRLTPLPKQRWVQTYKTKNYVESEAKKRARLVANEICGLAPYEKKAIDIIQNSTEKKCLRFLKKRLGNMKRTKQKLAKMQAFSIEMGKNN